MSFTRKDRKVRSESGKKIPDGVAEPGPDQRFVEALADALRQEFGASTSTIKTVARLTATNERTVKNWFDAKNGPTGENLVVLMRHYDVVLQTVLQLAGRDDLIVTMTFASTRAKLREMLRMLDQLPPGEPGE
jgi:hypothetical protein